MTKDEKYLALTWEDIDNIRRIIDELDGSIASEGMTVLEFNAEVARRFNKYKEEKKK